MLRGMESQKSLTLIGVHSLPAANLKKIIDSWNIKHTMSDPGHQNANGPAESAVKNIAVLPILSKPKIDYNVSKNKIK